jgi:glycosyltransferase 2 family protein
MSGVTDAVPPRGWRVFRFALLLLPLGVLGNIAYTLLATDAAMLGSLRELPRGYLFAALLLTLTPWLTGTLRLLVWSRFLGHRIAVRDVFRMTLVVDLGAAVSPTAIGGEAFRWGMLMQRGVRPGTAATLALLPKLEDAVFFAVAVPVTIVWTAAWRLPVVASTTRVVSQNTLIVMAAGLVLAVLARLLWTTTGQRLRARIRVTLRDARTAFALVVAGGKARFALTLCFTAAHWLARYSVVAALALFLGVPFDPVLFWLLQWVVFTLMSFVPTPGATGGAELAFTAVYATLLPSGVIGVATAAWRMFTFYVPVALAALVFALTARPVPPARPARPVDSAVRNAAVG